MRALLRAPLGPGLRTSRGCGQAAGLLFKGERRTRGRLPLQWGTLRGAGAAVQGRRALARPDARSAGWLHPVRGSHGTDPGAPPGHRPASHTPDSVSADKGYTNHRTRAYLRRRGIRHVIPEKADQAAGRLRRGSTGGRPPGFDKERYAKRDTVERAVNKLKQFRAVATRYDKRAYVYLGTLTAAALVICSAHDRQDSP